MKNPKSKTRKATDRPGLLLSFLLTSSVLLTPSAVQGQSKNTLATSSQNLYLAYPKGEKITINSSASFLIGSTNSGSSLKINGQPVRLNNKGFFAHVIKLKRGKNIFEVSSASTGTILKRLEITRPQLSANIKPTDWKLIPITPDASEGLTPGDLLILKARATPDASVSVQLNNKVINLSPANVVRKARSVKASKKSAPQPQVNWGQAVAYGKVFHNLPYSASDLYVGFYKIEPTDDFKKVKPTFILKKAGKTLVQKSSAEISVVHQPILAQTTVKEAVVRVAPGKARLTPLDKGVRLLVDGWKGSEYRCLYGKNKHIWISNKEIAFEFGSPKYSGPVPRSTVQTVNLNRSIYGDAIVIPLEQALPYEVSQSLQPNKLILRIYGAIADTDWVSQQYRAVFENGAAPKKASTDGKPGDFNADFAKGLVESVDWKQVDDDIYELNVNLRGHRQWGHSVAYDRNRLILHIKDAPNLTDVQKSLKGLKICVDPGHGGNQPGAMGCSGVTEAEVNLAITLKLKKILEKNGAQVIITRTEDKTLDLYDRVNIARAHNADILLSVHNNSLPDGRDPEKEHGTSTYFYNKEAKNLARALNDSLVASLKFPNIGARYQNLALTRPTQMLSVLVEIGFMINPDEYAQLLDDGTQEKAANAIYQGLYNYLKGTN